jgi:hypothetical protein
MHVLTINWGNRMVYQNSLRIKQLAQNVMVFATTRDLLKNIAT